METSVTQINSLASTIADLNKRIADTQGATNSEPNDLLDQRDEALRQLSELVSIQSFEQGQGEVNVLIGSGQSLVVGSSARQLAVVNSPDNAQLKEIAYQDGQFSQIITSFISGGEMSGLLSFRDSVLEDSFNELGRLALVLADNINDVHAQGLDLNSQFGGLFFADINTVDATLDRVRASSNNEQPADARFSVSIENSEDLVATDYVVEIADNNLMTITRTSDQVVVVTQAAPATVPASIEFDGISLNLVSGTVRAGDQYILQPTRDAARDIETVIFRPEEMAFASPVATDASLGNTGSGRINAGSLLSLEGTATELGGPADTDGSNLPLLSDSGMTPPLLVRFNSPSSYDILDNTDPGSPVVLFRNQPYVPGGSIELFSEDTGETLVRGLEADISTRTPVVIGSPYDNGFAGESVNIQTTDPDTFFEI